MINEKAVDHIRTYGVHHDTGAGRSKILFEDLGLVRDQKADYVILSGCHHNLQRSLSPKGEYRLKMLPEVVWESIQGK